MPAVELLIVVALAALGIVIVVRLRTKKDSAPGPRVDPVRAQPTVNDVTRLKVGDIVGHGGTDWLVRGTIRFDQDGFQWAEHFLDDATTKRWLSVEEDEDLDVVLWQSLPGDQAAGLDPEAGSVTLDGVEYRLDERGSARFTAEGTTGTAASGVVDYADFVAGDRRLSFERYGGGSWEAGTGTPVAPSSLEIYPSTDQQ